jgi:hypothetical protein
MQFKDLQDSDNKNSMMHKLDIPSVSGHLEPHSSLSISNACPDSEGIICLRIDKSNSLLCQLPTDLSNIEK